MSILLLNIVLFFFSKIKYPNYEHKALMASLGQKCRDRTRENKTIQPE